MRNLQIGVDKLVRNTSINSLLHTKSATCIISIIATVAYIHALSVVKLLKHVSNACDITS